LNDPRLLVLRAWLERLGPVVAILWALGLTLAAIFGGAIVKAQFHDKAALCDNATGAGSSTGDIAHCTLYTVLYQGGGFAHLAGIAVLVLGMFAGAFALYAKLTETPKA
jgi:hypothetical protein